MCYYVLNGNGHPIAWSTVRPLTPAELVDELEAIHEFDRTVTELIGSFDEDLIMAAAPDALDGYVDSDDGNENDIHTERETDDPMINAQVFLPRGNRNEIATIVGRKQKCRR